MKCPDCKINLQEIVIGDRSFYTWICEKCHKEFNSKGQEFGKDEKEYDGCERFYGC